MSVSRGGSKQLAYDVGDQVFQSEPWMFCIMAGKVKTHCYGCLGRPDDGRGDVRRCGGCRLAGYCSETCQKADWKPRHRDECKLLKGTVSEGASKPFLLDEDDMDRLLIVLKIIAKLKTLRSGSSARQSTQTSYLASCLRKVL
ncbi:hypothetical protein BV898_11262 [Hypsibius exemplaris]|uniref:MYND-type domain-containing protein n=1 Tax=Hypsibius exemplaris TaxID=2072580 RepID=A0A1W0WH56_HYPEX|nr:hypothetical protein BV898_11262 [Hypsibius exemplaris]